MTAHPTKQIPGPLVRPRDKNGITLSNEFKFACLTAFTTAVFESAAINLDLYQYYGEHPMRFLGY